MSDRADSIAFSIRSAWLMSVSAMRIASIKPACSPAGRAAKSRPTSICFSASANAACAISTLWLIDDKVSAGNDRRKSAICSIAGVIRVCKSTVDCVSRSSVCGAFTRRLRMSAKFFAS